MLPKIAWGLTRMMSTFSKNRWKMKLPIVVMLQGGLGNQMFQYAAGRSLAKRLETNLVLDLDWFIDNQAKYLHDVRRRKMTTNAL